MGLLNDYIENTSCVINGFTSNALGLVKKVLQQGHSYFDERSVLALREHGKIARTPLRAFFIRPFIYSAKRSNNSMALPTPISLLNRS